MLDVHVGAKAFQIWRMWALGDVPRMHGHIHESLPAAMSHLPHARVPPTLDRHLRNSAEAPRHFRFGGTKAFQIECGHSALCRGGGGGGHADAILISDDEEEEEVVVVDDEMHQHGRDDRMSKSWCSHIVGNTPPMPSDSGDIRLFDTEDTAGTPAPSISLLQVLTSSLQRAVRSPPRLSRLLKPFSRTPSGARSTAYDEASTQGFSSQLLADVLSAALPTKVTMRDLVHAVKAKSEAFKSVPLSSKVDCSYSNTQIAERIAECKPDQVTDAQGLLS